MPSFFLLAHRKYYMGFATFREYVQMREGLWLADKNAVPGMSKLNPFPATQTKLKRIAPKPLHRVRTIPLPIVKMVPSPIKQARG